MPGGIAIYQPTPNQNVTSGTTIHITGAAADFGLFVTPTIESVYAQVEDGPQIPLSYTPKHMGFIAVAQIDDKITAPVADGSYVITVTAVFSQDTFSANVTVDVVPPPGFWPPGQPINNTDSSRLAVAACSFQSQLYLFWKANDPSNMIYFTGGVDNGLPWPPGQVINNRDSTPQPLAACEFQNQLYLFWKANDLTNKIYYSASADGQTWPPGQVINNRDSTAEPLAACEFQNQLYLFWKGNTSNKIYYSASADGKTWPRGQVISAGTTAAALAACAVYVPPGNQLQLYLFWQGPSNQIYYSSSADGKTWAPGQAVNNVDTTSGSVACIYGGPFEYGLTLFWMAPNAPNNIYFSNSQDGKTWPPGQPINYVDFTAAPPAVEFFLISYFVFWADSSNRIYYSPYAIIT
jgi:hypothetical protein